MQEVELSWVLAHMAVSFPVNRKRNIVATLWENLVMPDTNCKDPDQHEHLLGLISTIVVNCLDSVIECAIGIEWDFSFLNILQWSLFIMLSINREFYYSEICLKGPLKNRQNKGLKAML